jgi:DnaD/phage-associated family protein
VSAGFPDGVRWTPVPDLFFSRYLPELADGATVKVMLHVLWETYRRPVGGAPAVRLADLVADAGLGRGLRALGVAEGDVGAEVERAVDDLCGRGLLLEARVAGEGGPARWLFVNGREGRAALARLRDARLVLPDLPPPGAPASGDGRPNVFALYEANIGLLTPMLAEELRDAADSYPPDWIEDAFRRAVAANARKWAYVRAILERWAREGRDDETDQRSAGAARERDIEGPYAPFIEH